MITSVFDALNRTTSLTGTHSAVPLYSYAYQYDKVGNVMQIGESYANASLNRTVTNTYDAINRLTQEAVTGSGAATTTFAYDNAHNRTQMVKGGLTTSYTYNALNQLTQFSSGATTVNFSYDDNGNRATRSVGSAGALFAWDYENRLVSHATLGNQTKLEFAFDYRTRRAEIINRAYPSGVLRYTDRFVFSGGTSVRELRNGTATVDYVRGSDWGGGVGGILYSLRGAAPSYTHYNRRGDVTAKTDAAGTLTYQAEYEAFGKRTTQTGATLDRQKSNTKDEDIPGYANEGFRFRDLETGTFISRDPAGFVDGPNLYAYVVQNPWTKFDPEGLQSAEQINELRQIMQSADPARMPEFQQKYRAAVEARIDTQTGNSKNGFIRGINGPGADKYINAQITSNPAAEAVVATQEGQKLGADIGTVVAAGKIATAKSPSGTAKETVETNQKKVPNPDGSKGKPDHQAKIDQLEGRARSEAGEGETVLRERKIQGQDSNRRPDVQIVDEQGKTRKVFEAERRPESSRNQKREAEYKRLNVEQETHKVGDGRK